MKSFVVLCLVGLAAAAPMAEERAINGGECGKAKVPLSRIVGGSTAQKGQYPWIASMRYRASSTAKASHSCGCSIIDDQWVLVAAHCFINSKNPNNFIVRVGTFNQTAGSAEPEATDFEVEKIIQHEKFSMAIKISNDIALMKLKGKVDFSSNYVNRVCLPETDNFPTDNKELTVVGWGDEANSNGKQIPQLLKHTKLTAQSDASCKKTWGSFMWVDGQMLCASAANTSPCVGDSGGPLMLPDDNTGVYTQVGVVSFGESSCAGPRPPVFTRVTAFLDWIKTNMAAN